MYFYFSEAGSLAKGWNCLYIEQPSYLFICWSIYKENIEDIIIIIILFHWDKCDCFYYLFFSWVHLLFFIIDLIDKTALDYPTIQST